MQPQMQRFSHPVSLFLKTMLILGTLSITLLFANSLLWKSSSVKKSYSPAWVDASYGAPASVVKKALYFNTTAKFDAKALKVLPIPSDGAGTLYLFDFRSPQLCGVGGCVYLLYHESGKLMLQLTVNPHIPPKDELVKVSQLTYNGFPCLTFTQTTDMESIVSRSKYCYGGKQFEYIGDEFTPVGKQEI